MTIIETKVIALVCIRSTTVGTTFHRCGIVATVEVKTCGQFYGPFNVTEYVTCTSNLILKNSCSFSYINIHDNLNREPLLFEK